MEKNPATEKLTETDLRIRQAMQSQLQTLDLRQNELAARIRQSTGKNVQQPNVNQIIKGERGLIPQSLLDVLEVLGLAIVVVPKDQIPAPENQQIQKGAAVQAERKTA